MTALDCPLCGLTNPAGTLRCDCGFEFSSGRLGSSLLSDSERALMPPGRRFVTVNLIGTTLYGRANKRKLTGREADNARALGCRPIQYQSVEWFVIAGVPILPGGCYRVLEKERRRLELPSYVLAQIPLDRRQVLVHYLVGWSWLPFAALLFFAT